MLSYIFQYARIDLLKLKYYVFFDATHFVFSEVSDFVLTNLEWAEEINDYILEWK